MRLPNALMAWLAALGLAAAASGCVRSGVTRYYTLAALAPAGPAAGTTAGALGVGPVRLPQHLRQNAMVVRVEPHRLEYRDADLWAEAPEDAVLAAIRENLARLSGLRPVLRYPWRGGDAPRCQVAVEVTAFELAGTREAVLTARWEIRDANGVLVRTADATYREPAEHGVASLAEAQSRALLRLCQDIAAALAAC